ncbi:trypsin-like peptidase domain-containing protein [uncultured Marivita sp.]|uniref:trypsin-like serine peptidase n=1 Tax=uncultured Marivita sp. TaxID=888080 RepID=UPI00260F3812|nr:trypsin-like peptidase domain-containing protein [uncultured Marivita sp.]
MAKSKKEGVGHVQDSPNDPVFVPNFDQIESLKKKMTEESLTPDRLDYGDIRETICGTTDDSQPVEQYDGSLGVTRAFVDTHQSPVGVLRWHTNLASVYTNPGNVAGVRWCTGTLIADNLFLTAGHCFDQTGGGWNRPRVNGTSNIISSQEIATRMNVEFNFQVNSAGVQQSPVSFAVEELIEYRLDGLDFAIVRLAGNPGQQFGVTRLAEDDGTTGDMICIIGHPAGQPKRIEAGPITNFDDFRVRYNDIDTLGGNSGSGILRASDGCIVGIHTNGGCNAAMTGSNFGLRVTRMRAASPTIQGLGAHTNTIRDIITSTVADRITTVVADRLTTVRDDRIQTLPSFDQVPTSILRDRRPTTVVDDLRPTNVLRDRRPTSIIDDRGPTNILLDRGPTSVLLDQGPTSFIADRGTDPIGDRKASGLDKQFSDRIPDRFGNLRGGLFGEGGAMPFVMATPHHATGAMAGLQQTYTDDSEAAQIEELVAYYEDLSAMAEEILAEMAEIEALFDDPTN